MPLASLFRRNPHRIAAHEAYLRIVEGARQPRFFDELGVPDTLDGRFEVIALHAFLVLNRLKADHARTGRFAQVLFDTMFADMDRSLREMGAGDLGVGRRVKDMAKAFYGRIVAYEQGLSGSDRQLADALRRNLYGTAAPQPAQIEALAQYVRAEAARLAAADTGSLLRGDIRFGNLSTDNE